VKRGLTDSRPAAAKWRCAAAVTIGTAYVLIFDRESWINRAFTSKNMIGSMDNAANPLPKRPTGTRMITD
jgi:hypothetical protein